MQKGVEAFDEALGKQPCHLVGVGKGVVVAQSAGQLDVDGRVARLHQFQIDNQPARPAVAVGKGVDGLETDVQLCQFCGDGLRAIGISGKQIGQLGLYQVGRNGLRVGAENTHGDTPIHSLVLRPIRQNKRVDLPDHKLREGRLRLRKLLHKVERLLVPCRFQTVFEGLAFDGAAAHCRCRLAERKGVALDGVGVVGVAYRKIVQKLLTFGVCQGTAKVKLRLFGGHLRKNIAFAMGGAGICGTTWDTPQLAILGCAVNFAPSAKGAHSANADLPFFGGLFGGQGHRCPSLYVCCACWTQV